MAARAPSGSERRVYAGIGSRETPPRVLAIIEAIASGLARAGWVLRTGLSPGADQAFYRGALAGAGHAELYLPWPGFCAEERAADEGEGVTALDEPSPAAYEQAARFYRGWHGHEWAALSPSERALLARDGHELLGAGLDDPVGYVVCWTPDGGLDGSDPRSQGTGQALRIAAALGIAVLNLARPEHERCARGLARQA
jgi:hypothetical protein